MVVAAAVPTEAVEAAAPNGKAVAAAASPKQVSPVNWRQSSSKTTSSNGLSRLEEMVDQAMLNEAKQWTSIEAKLDRLIRLLADK